MRLALLAIAAVCLCRAEGACPWLNAATAGGILGGPVTTSVKPTACEFTRNKSVLRIEVQKKPATVSEKCESKPTPQVAIGNEAVACTANGAHLVIGRVRDQKFAVRLEMNDPAAGELVRKVAEQVAGSLF